MSEDKILVFRQILSSVKKRLIESTSYSTQDPKQIYEIQKIMKEIYFALRKVVEKKEPVSSLKPYSLDLLFEEILNKKLTDDERNDLMYYIRRDLITFPFTIDTFHMNANLVKNEDVE